MTADVDDPALSLVGATRIVALLRSGVFAPEGAGPVVGPAESGARLTVARFADGAWRWRHDPSITQGIVRVNDLPIVDRAPVFDGDIVDFRPVPAHLGEPAAACVRLGAKPRLEPRRYVAPNVARIDPWRDYAFELAPSSLRMLGPLWLAFTGPGGRLRALARRGSRRPLFIVPTAAAPDDMIVDVDVVNQRVLVERRGVCSLAELIEVTQAQGARLELKDAIDLLDGAVAKGGGFAFDVHSIELCADGGFVVFRGPIDDATGRAVLDALEGLVCATRDPAEKQRTLADALSALYSRRRAQDFVDDAWRYSARDVCARLAVLAGSHTSTGVGDVVARLFPERVAAEALLQQQIAMLDDAGVDALAIREAA